MNELTDRLIVHGFKHTFMLRTGVLSFSEYQARWAAMDSFWKGHNIEWSDMHQGRWHCIGTRVEIPAGIMAEFKLRFT